VLGQTTNFPISAQGLLTMLIAKEIDMEALRIRMAQDLELAVAQSGHDSSTCTRLLASTTLRRNLNSPRAAKPWAGCLSVS
jgi:hypothetical protein